MLCLTADELEQLLSMDTSDILKMMEEELNVNPNMEQTDAPNNPHQEATFSHTLSHGSDSRTTNREPVNAMDIVHSVSTTSPAAFQNLNFMQRYLLTSVEMGLPDVLKIPIALSEATDLNVFFRLWDDNDLQQRKEVVWDLIEQVGKLFGSCITHPAALDAYEKLRDALNFINYVITSSNRAIAWVLVHREQLLATK